MSEIALKVESITKYFHEPQTFQVLKEVSFEAQKGEFLALVGKSGSGKSTLLYILSTMDTNFTGELNINGVNLTGRQQSELARFRNRHIGFVFQFHYLLPEFSSLSNVMLPALKLAQFSRQEIEARAYDILKLLDIQDQALKKTNKLSGGQQQRVAIARALINEPAVIMGDEPTGNLDTTNTDIVFGILKELAQEKKQTIIIVTHDQDFANKCDRIIELSDGVLIR